MSAPTDRLAPSPAHEGHTRKTLLARNSLLNLAGQILPILVGVITISYVVRGLGTGRFGVLSIGWMMLGYFGVFDLGMGRATTKSVSECLRPRRMSEGFLASVVQNVS
jgi:O-antigen/teichoic acid export membrane protein